MAHTAIELNVIVQGGCNARVDGRTNWSQVNGSWRATLPVQTSAYSDSEVLVQMRIPSLRLWAPTALLLFRGIAAYRLDVNQKHRENGVLHDGTHWQWCPRFPGPEIFKMEPAAPSIPQPGPVGGSNYCSILHYFLDRFAIDRSRLTWIDPPEV